MAHRLESRHTNNFGLSCERDSILLCAHDTFGPRHTVVCLVLSSGPPLPVLRTEHTRFFDAGSVLDSVSYILSEINVADMEKKSDSTFVEVGTEYLTWLKSKGFGIEKLCSSQFPVGCWDQPAMTVAEDVESISRKGIVNALMVKGKQEDDMEHPARADAHCEQAADTAMKSEASGVAATFRSNLTCFMNTAALLMFPTGVFPAFRYR